MAGEETNPFAAWRSGPFPMPPGAGHVRRHPLDGRGRAGRPPPLPGADRRELGGLRRSAGLRELRVLRLVRLPDRGQGRPGGAAAPGARLGPGRDPPREPRRRDHPRPVGPPRHRRPLPRPRPRRSSEVRATHVVLAAGAFETPRLLLRQGLANSSDQVGRNLMYHFQTLTVGAFPFRLHGDAGPVGHRRARRPHRRRRRAAQAGRGPPGCRGSGAGWSSTAGPASPCRSRSSTAPARTTRRRCATRRCASGSGSSRCRARTWPSRPTGSTSTRRCATRGASPPAGSPTRPHHHELVMSDHAAPILEAVLRDAGAEWTITSTSPPRGDGRRPQPARHGAGQLPHHGHLPDGRRPDHQRGRPLRPHAGTSRTCSSPTRRCSPPRPATTPRSRSWRWPPGPPTCSRAQPLRATTAHR